MKKHTVLLRLLKHENSGITFFFLVLCLLIGILNPAFWNYANIINMLRGISFLVIVGVGMTFILIGGGLDLSVGSIIGLGGMVTGLLMQQGIPVILSFILGLLLGVGYGFLNGFIITRFKIPPLIVTLGNLYVARGIIHILTRGRPVYPFPDSFNNLGMQGWLGIPYSVYIMIGLVIIGHFILTKTVFGRCIYAIGGNEETARTSGIDVDRVKIVSYMLVSMLASLSGILMSARMNSAVPNAGEGWELKVIASVIIGGTSMFGGVGTVLGSVMGAGIMSVLSTGLVLLRISAYWQNVVIGIIIILAVGFDQYKRVLSNR